jgi:hypothetical protein
MFDLVFDPFFVTRGKILANDVDIGAIDIDDARERESLAALDTAE